MLLLVKYYIDNNFIQWSSQEKKYDFVPSKREKAMKVLPKSIAEIAGYRLNVLDGIQKRILKAGACIGKSFSEDRLALVLDQDGARITRDELQSNLEIIQKFGFITSKRNKRFSVLRRVETMVDNAKDKKTTKSFMRQKEKHKPSTPKPLAGEWDFSWAVYFEAVRSWIVVFR